MRTMQRAGARSRARARQEAAAAAELKRRRADHCQAAAATTITFLVAAWFWFIVRLPGPLGWSVQVLLLCLVVAAAAGRALVGQAERAEEGLAGRGTPALLGAVVAVAAVLPYLPSLGIGFLSDDFGLYYGASHAASPAHAFGTSALPGFLRPMAILLWWVGARLWGPAPAGYHAANLALHAGNAVLVYVLGKRWIGSSYGGFLAGMLFALHPLHVEPVVWACCNGDLLSTGFCLLSLVGVEAALGAASPGRRVAAMVGSWVAFALALMSKESAIALPGAVFLLVMLRGKARRGGANGDERAQRGAAGRGMPALQALITGPYVLLVAGYLAWRVATLGSLGGYRVHLSLWNTAFPSAPLRQMAVFLFPVNRMLTGPRLFYVLAAVMVAGAYWWLRGLPVVPSKRLLLWVGFVVVMTIPVWVMPAGTLALEHSRYAYLPTIGLAWLFGDLCAGRGRGWRRSGAVALTTLAAAGALTVWYIAPWQGAHAKAERVIGEATELLGQVEQEHPDPVLYVQGVPRQHRGAWVMITCLPQAVRLRLGRPAGIRVVSDIAGDVTPEVFALSTLMPGEYLAAWQDEENRFTILRRGRGEDRR